MRDPMANYDYWLERPYVQHAEREHQAELHREWVERNTTVGCTECGCEIGYLVGVEITESDENLKTAFCPRCEKHTEVALNLTDVGADDFDDRDVYDCDIEPDFDER